MLDGRTFGAFKQITADMKQRSYLLLLLGLLGMSHVLGQSNLAITGRVQNEQGEPLAGATVVVLQAADSILSSFGMTNPEGAFVLRRVAPGEYILQASFLGYKKHSQAISVAGSDLEVGTLRMEASDLTLDEVEIQGERTPIFFKKDTVEYNADAFKTQPNATVEELLKRLPGLEVEDDGTVKAQGEEVQRVLVDGKEFFGKDPQMATKNLPADVVNRVQVFDRQSEMAEFTGVDDGEREKTINLTLKEDKKKGVFGRASGGFGPRETPEGELAYDRFEGKLNMNRFNKKLQFSVIGMGNNINQQGFSLGEYSNFVGGMRGMMRRRSGGGGSLGGVPISNGLSDGFVQTFAGGFNLNYQLSEKTKLNTSYVYTNIGTELDQQTYRENFLNDRIFTTDRQEVQENQSGSHQLNLRLDHEIDSMRQLIFRGNASMRDGDAFSRSFNQTLDPMGNRQNQSETENFSRADKLTYNTELTYRQRFQKRGRSLVAEGTFAGRENTQNADLLAANLFFPDDPVRDSSELIWQNQFQQDEQVNYGIELRFTEPVGRKKYLSLEYEHRNFQYESTKEFFDLEDFGNVEVFNPELSSYYQSDYIYDRAGLKLLFNGDQSSLTLGTDAQYSRLDGELTLTNDTTITNNVFNILPNVRWNYTFASKKRLRFDYSTSVQEPSIEQLQPIVDNSDPLRIYQGNPALVPSYTHNARLNFFSFSQFSFTSIFAFLNATYTTNRITNATVIDSLFRQVTQPVNVDSDFRLTLYGGSGFPIRPLNIRVNLNTNITYNRGILFVNAIENLTDRLTSSGGLTIENQNKDIFDVSIGAQLSHSLTEYSVNEELNQTWLNQRYELDATVNLGDKWNLGTKVSHRIFGGDAFTDRQLITLWEASVSRFLLNNKRGQLTLAAYDLLNQNRGITRTSELNYIEEQRINSLSRFFLLRFTFNLSKFGAEMPKEDLRIIRKPG